MRTQTSRDGLASPPMVQKRSRARIVILLLLSIGTMINYLDRTILGIVAPQLTRGTGNESSNDGHCFLCFCSTYAPHKFRVAYF